MNRQLVQVVDCRWPAGLQSGRHRCAGLDWDECQSAELDPVGFELAVMVLLSLSLNVAVCQFKDVRNGRLTYIR